MKRTPLKRKTPLRRTGRSNSRTIRVGNMEYEIPAGISERERRHFIDAAEAHALEHGTVTLAEATRIYARRLQYIAQMHEALHRPPPPSGRRKRSRTKYARRPRDLAYMAWVKQHPCCLTMMEGWRRSLHPGGAEGARILGLWHGPLRFDGCRGEVEAHHAGEHGRGQKPPDNTCIPLCAAHHRGDDVGITRYRGPFAGWPRGSVKRWELAMVELYQRAYAEHQVDQDSTLF